MLLTPSLVTEEQAKPYLCNDCHQFAYALHLLTGKPIVSIVVKHPLPEDEIYGEEETDKYGFEHAHAGVLVAEGIYADVQGIHQFDAERCGALFGGLVPGSSMPSLQVFDIEKDDSLLLEFFSYYADGEPIDEIVDHAKSLMDGMPIIDLIKHYKFVQSVKDSI